MGGWDGVVVGGSGTCAAVAGVLFVERGARLIKETRLAAALKNQKRPTTQNTQSLQTHNNANPNGTKGSICVQALTTSGGAGSWQPSFCFDALLQLIVVNMLTAEAVMVRTQHGGGMAGPLRVDLAGKVRVALCDVCWVCVGGVLLAVRGLFDTNNLPPTHTTQHNTPRTVRALADARIQRGGGARRI